MKKIITLAVLLIILGLTIDYKETILKNIDKLLYPNRTTELGTVNEYYRNYDFNYVQNTNNFSPQSKQDLLNIYYTAINAGMDTFTFYCPEEYSTCLQDVSDLANDQAALSDINNFVHPFNGFSNIETKHDSLGRVTITLEKTYTADEINEINAKVDELYPQLVNPNLPANQNIKAIHDYIINTTKYDSDRTDHNIINYKSDTAYGPLFQGYAICGGYTDLMELFLEKMQIRSYKASSDNHIWNAVNLNNTWYHLDLTWDDPVTPNKTDILEYNFFLIDTNTLLSTEKTEHDFDQNVYSELKGTYF